MFAIYPVDQYLYQRNVNKILRVENNAVTKVHKANRVNDVIKQQQNEGENRLEMERGRVIDVRV